MIIYNKKRRIFSDSSFFFLGFSGDYKDHSNKDPLQVVRKEILLDQLQGF